MTKAAPKKTLEPVEAGSTNAMVSQSTKLMDNVIQLASTPDFDISKLERLIALYEKQQEAIARQEYSAAMSRVQAKVKKVVSDLWNDQTKSGYASMVALDEGCREAYTNEGFSLDIDTETIWIEQVPYLRVYGIMSHTSGHEQRKSIDIPADGKGPSGGSVMTRTHASVSALTYGRKAILEMFFNIPVEKRQDDDGNGASVRGLPRDKVKQLNDAIDKSKDKDALLARIKKRYGIDNIGELPVEEFNTALININKIVRKEKEAGNASH